MWRLPLPDISHAEADLICALTQANGDWLYKPDELQTAALGAMYEMYDQSRGRPLAVLLGDSLGPDFLAAIYTAYEQTQVGRRLSYLRDRIKANARLCPYCGFGEIYTLDHYLARATYRGLAIYPRNLVPCCHPCNHKKGTSGVSVTEQCSHPYFDVFPPGQFLEAQIAIDEELGLRVEFEIVECEGMTSGMLERLRIQMQRLDLNRRYESQVVMFMMDHREGIESAAEGGVDSLRSWLQKAHHSQIASYGLNDWRAALLDGLSRSDEFCLGGYRHAFGEKMAGA